MEQDLKKLTVAQLKIKCKEKGVAVSGRKQELIDRLMGAPSGPRPSKPQINAAMRWALRHSGAKIIRRNAYGNFEDPETHFVFDKATKQAIGKQVEDKVVPLTQEEIRICQDNKWLL